MIHQDAKAAYQSGVEVFALMFIRWMDTNRWSHPTITALARAALGGLTWLHSSQISGFRHAKLLSPGPRTFKAIEILNKALWEYKQTGKLIPGTKSSNHYTEPYVITENGVPPDYGWFVEVFIGDRVPTDLDLSKSYFTEEEATNFSKRFAKLVRKLMVMQDLDPIDDLQTIIRTHYPAGDATRVAKLEEILWSREIWGAEELKVELPALVSMTAALEGPASEELLVESLK